MSNRLVIAELIADFSLFDDWEDRYEHLIALGRNLEALHEDEKIPAHKLSGCVSQVWLVSNIKADVHGKPCLVFRGDSDAYIVKGLLAIMLIIASGLSAKDILALDIKDIFNQLGLQEHLSAQRLGGLQAMMIYIQKTAQHHLNTAA